MVKILQLGGVGSEIEKLLLPLKKESKITFSYFGSISKLSKYINMNSLDEKTLILIDYDNLEYSLISSHLDTDIKAWSRFAKVYILAETLNPFVIGKFIETGIEEYFVKPYSKKILFDRISKFVKEKTITASKSQAYRGDTIVNISNQLQKIVLSSIKSILITGESGTGKEIVAQILENLISKNQAFLKVNCGALQQELLNSELFGHVKGAYTGAYQSREGLLAKADGGGSFLMS